MSYIKYKSYIQDLKEYPIETLQIKTLDKRKRVWGGILLVIVAFVIFMCFALKQK